VLPGLAGVDHAAARRSVGHRAPVRAGHGAHPVPDEESTENIIGFADPPPVAVKVVDPRTVPAADAVKLTD
jgi:hypothetical protein